MSRHDGRRVWSIHDQGMPCCGHPLAIHGPDGCMTGWGAQDDDDPCPCNLRGYSTGRRPTLTKEDQP